ncbi:hypothetical protein SAMN05421505_11680 [Sinosporangium album]|uniref:Uncharacterized protein n=1 Tax=Sinosporangium album TaxID=504805 RepID=A0A1G8CNY1_9ACTN|nr:hypothetical protein SAMN05421505_11680 [Sinosporangium album]
MIFAVVCVAVSGALHMLAGGGAVRLSLLVAAMALLAAGAYALGGRPRGLGVILGAGFTSQYGLHHLFSWGNAESITHAMHSEHSTGFGMFFVHAAAALASCLWLSRGESSLASLLELVTFLASTSLARLLPRLLVLLVPYERTAAPAVADLSEPPVTTLLAASVTRRGPPLSFSVL